MSIDSATLKLSAQRLLPSLELDEALVELLL